MADMLAENLSGKAVMGVDGTELGILYNITMNLDSGELVDIVVEPQEDSDAATGRQRDEQGRYHIPVEKVSDVKDYIVVER
ncbi:MAG: PRC-barrel domain-containing protein [Halobacteriaceae archaeon]